MEYSASIIPKEQYDPALEEKVKYYVSIIPTVQQNTKRIPRAKQVESNDPYEIEVWQREELRRIKEGHFGLSGKFYFWYNYVKMWDIETGLIRPEFRMCQQEWFRQVEECQNSKEWGLICVKRRRVGASWLEAADVLHDCIVNDMFKAGMTSKTEDDAKELFKKVKFIYDNLPSWMRPTSTAGNTQTHIDFSFYIKDETGSRRKVGKQSEIKVKPPTETGWEGFALRKWVMDEAGKVVGLKAIFSMANEVMRAGSGGFRRVGTPLVFGTSGDIGKEGKDLRDMWYNHDVYRLRQFFFGGWMGILVDEYGNDMVEEAVRCLVYERKRREGLSEKEYNDFLQQYPLTVQEAFTSNEYQGIGNQLKITQQITSLMENPVKQKKGYFRMDTSENILFIPDNRGSCIIYEDPKVEYKDLYIAGLDPTDHEVEDVRKASSLSMFIMSKQDGLLPPRIVFQYTDRPNIPRDFYEQALMALIYYNNTKVLIERNKPGMITYMDERGYKHLMQTTPYGMTRLLGGNPYAIGVHMGPGVKKYGEELVGEYVQNYCEHIPCIDLLEEMQSYGVINTDRVSALIMCLIFLKDDKRQARSSTDIKRNIPTFGYKNINGRIILSKGR